MPLVFWAHFFRKLVSRPMLVPIYAERGGAPQPAVFCPRLFLSGARRPAALRICDFGVFSVCTATLWWRARMRMCSFFGTSNLLAVSKAASKSARAHARVWSFRHLRCFAECAVRALIARAHSHARSFWFLSCLLFVAVCTGCVVIERARMRTCRLFGTSSGLLLAPGLFWAIPGLS